MNEFKVGDKVKVRTGEFSKSSWYRDFCKENAGQVIFTVKEVNEKVRSCWLDCKGISYEFDFSWLELAKEQKTEDISVKVLGVTITGGKEEVAKFLLDMGRMSMKAEEIYKKQELFNLAKEAWTYFKRLYTEFERTTDDK